MLLDQFGREIHKPIVEIIEDKMLETTKDIYKNLLTSYFSEQVAIMSWNIKTPKVVDDMGNQITREQAGLPPIKIDGGKKINMPLQWKEVSVPITIEKEVI